VVANDELRASAKLTFSKNPRLKSCFQYFDRDYNPTSGDDHIELEYSIYISQNAVFIPRQLNRKHRGNEAVRRAFDVEEGTVEQTTIACTFSK
jgi:hypothetical protein